MNTKQFLPILAVLATLTILHLPSCTSGNSTSQRLTRGIGTYPGNPDEYYGPTLTPDNSTLRNVAHLRTAYHSSSYDYNLTAQLVTDGITTDKHPASINLSTQNGELLKNEREWLFDGKPDSRYRMKGQDIFLQLAVHNCPFTTDRITLRGSVTIDEKKPHGYTLRLLASENGTDWITLSEESSASLIGRESPKPSFIRRRPPVDPNAPKPSFTFTFTPPPPTRILELDFPLAGSLEYTYYKVAITMQSADEWSFSDWDFYRNSEPVSPLPSQYFNSSWMSATSGEEWLYVDLGAPATFDKVNLHWINKAIAGKIQSSDDALTWTDIADLPGGDNKQDNIKLPSRTTSRYLRVQMNQSINNERYILSELEVIGKGGLVVLPHKPATADENNSLNLTGGSWKLQRSSSVNASGEELSTASYKADDWIVATVPGTVLTSYLNIGAIPDPNHADDQLQISESFFNSNFWYRNEFNLPPIYSTGRSFLNFDGINWKANIYLNGKGIGRLEGAFMRGKFDVTDILLAGQTNTLAVEIIKNDHPGAIKEQTKYSTDQNGGILGADNPTFHATVGWDWIPTIRGRDIGIWNDVFLSHTGSVSIIDPFVRAELALPDTTEADIIIEATVQNHSTEAVTGKLKGNYGDLSTFEMEVTLAASETKTLKLDASNTPSLKVNNPRLWWPKGYGAPHLYDVNLLFELNTSEITDRKQFKSGIRRMTFNEEGGTLNLFVNGRRFIGFGGNWGFGESNLNYRGREYDIAVAYHADMNFTMIRNWVGQIGDEEFYDACDRHGIMVWQDFWLANPYDGPNPYDNALFMSNVRDFVKRIRNHPSIGIYVGRNEGNPPESLDTPIRQYLAETHPDIHYISNSAMGVVSGGGPYRALPPRDYFLLYGHNKFHSERGMPNVMNYESLEQTFSPDSLWPQSSQYGLHDYTLGGTQGASAQSAASFNEMIAKAFGAPSDARQFAEWAQWINYNGYRAIFEGRSEFRQGMLLWMSHPAWPSMVWQTYDYYFDPTGAYFGCKKACEPLHIQWNPVWDDVEVVNYHAFDHANLLAKASLINIDGSIQWEKEATIDIREDATVKAFKLEFPETLDAAHLIKLTLSENGKVISDNVYWRGREDGDYKLFNQMPRVKLTEQQSAVRNGSDWHLSVTLKNETSTPALMIRLKAVGSQSGKRILPAFFSDNYIFLMPGEERRLEVSLKTEDSRGEVPRLEISGFNV
ncbi:MAG: discoidin domain-containing protein [Tannerellaceae bacterium]|jgi:hypothetical protein|nr:discoidin domain-containing protein [Tannerellaceae bacterium]